MTAFVRRLFSGDNETRDVVVVLAAALLLWEIGVRLFHASPLILPAPSAIFAAFMETPGLFLRHLGFTLGMTCIGFVLAVVLGVALAVGIVYSRFLERTIYTLLGGAEFDPESGAGTAVRDLDGDGTRAQGGDRLDARDLPDRDRHRARLALGRSGHAASGAGIEGLVPGRC